MKSGHLPRLIEVLPLYFHMTFWVIVKVPAKAVTRVRNPSCEAKDLGCPEGFLLTPLAKDFSPLRPVESQPGARIGAFPCVNNRECRTFYSLCRPPTSIQTQGLPPMGGRRLPGNLHTAPRLSLGGTDQLCGADAAFRIRSGGEAVLHEILCFVPWRESPARRNSSGHAGTRFLHPGHRHALGRHHGAHERGGDASERLLAAEAERGFQYRRLDHRAA